MYDIYAYTAKQLANTSQNTAHSCRAPSMTQDLTKLQCKQLRWQVLAKEIFHLVGILENLFCALRSIKKLHSVTDLDALEWLLFLSTKVVQTMLSQRNYKTILF
ncbi:Hypothetical_protein [Hexamita inflata]|uniref:Hypothetical_protein n=1 Tax=Hexamita inflata TaxID=28002 RepID=A0AA86PI72_9EUKA|nr:Hypothetical protein HINF_LOCUS27770 [Hexamita inflata]